MKQPTNAEVEAAMPTLCPHYHHAMTLLDEVLAWSKAGFPGATLDDLVKIIHGKIPEQIAEIRLRAEKNVRELLGLPIRRSRSSMGVLSGRLPGWRRK